MHAGWKPDALRSALAAIQDEGFTQADLAELADVNRSQVNRWTRGENRPTYDKALLLARRIARKNQRLADEFMTAAGYGPPGAEPEPWPLGIQPEDDHEQFILEHDGLTDDDKRLMIRSYRKAKEEFGPPPELDDTQPGDRSHGRAASLATAGQPRAQPGKSGPPAAQPASPAA